MKRYKLNITSSRSNRIFVQILKECGLAKHFKFGRSVKKNRRELFLNSSREIVFRRRKRLRSFEAVSLYLLEHRKKKVQLLGSCLEEKYAILDYSKMLVSVLLPQLGSISSENLTITDRQQRIEFIRDQMLKAEQRLSNSDYLFGDLSFSDFVFLAVLKKYRNSGFNFSQYPNIKLFAKRMKKRIKRKHRQASQKKA